MILSQIEFDQEFAVIKNELFREDKDNFIWKKGSMNELVMDKLWYEQWYEDNMIRFPMGTNSRQDTFILNDNFILNYKLYYYYSQKERTTKEKQEILKQIADTDIISLRFDLEEAIDERISNFIYYFKEGLKLLKKGSYFSHIKDNTAIIKNMLNYYQQVRANKDIQLSFFSNVKLHGDVADQMLDMLIAIMKDKLQMIDPDFTMLPPSPIKLFAKETKIKWLGSQHDFAELIIELRKSGYISFEDESFAGMARECTQVFDFSASKRKSSANVAGNLTTYLKPVYNHDNTESEYFFQKEGYKRKFDGFPNNPLKLKADRA